MPKIKPTNQKYTESSFHRFWCSVKDDYRTLAELEDMNVIENYADIDEDEHDV